MNKLLKQFVAFSIAAVMVLGMLPFQTLAASRDDAAVHSAVQPFSGTADLIEQVKAQLVAEGKMHTHETADEKLVAAVERESSYSYNEAMTAIVMGLLNSRSGSEGRIDVSRLNLSAGTMKKLVEQTVRSYYLDDSFELSYDEEDGIVTAVNFVMEDAFTKVLDEVDTADAVKAASQAASIQSFSLAPVDAYTATAASTYAAPRFSDVPADAWFAEPVAYAAEHGLMSGVGNGKFAPNTPMTRAMAVQVLYRIAGSPAAGGKNPFKDVPADEWYTTAVLWAVANGITGGTSANTFSPNRLVTREQLVTFLYKYAKLTDMKLTTTDISKYRDASKVSGWAVEAFKWAVSAGVISGLPNNMLAPQKSATRAECATILTKFDQMVKGEPTEPTEPATKPTEPAKPTEPNHEIIHVPAKPANCKEDGNIEYWYCKTHDKYFADEARTHEITKADTVIPKNLHAPAVDENGKYVETTFNWAQIPPILLDEKGQPVIGEDGNPKLNPDVVFVDKNGQPIMTEQGQPAIVGAYLDGTPITSITLTFNAEKKEISAMPTTKPDYWLDWNDKNGDFVMDQDEIAEAYQNLHHRDTYMCTSVTYKCAGCGQEFTEEVELTNVLMTQDYIDKTLQDYGAQVAQQEIENYVGQKTMEYYQANGQMPSEEQQNAWVAEIQPKAEQKAQMAAGQKAMELYPNMNSTVYTATSKVNPDIHESVDATREQLMRDWGLMKQFNAAYPQYLGYAAPYWTSKNTETNPLDAVIYMCNAQEEPFVPVYNMDFMVAMLSQAFMSYVMQYGYMIDAMLADAMAVVDHKELDQIDKLLLLHDWIAEYGTFDMQSMIDQTDGSSSGSDPIAMTIFGTLLRSQIPDDPNKEVEWDGAVCLGYTATYAILLQQAFGIKSTENPIVDFVQIKYLSNVAETSVAAGESGFGDGDAMFNSPHFFNAVKLNNGNWYYVDTCYDDVNIEVISQYRVETDGNVSHDNFLLSPQTVIDMYEGNFQFIDSLYDNKLWERVPDGQGGFKMKTVVDGEDHIYATENEAKEAQKKAEEKGETLQIFYVYEEKNAPAGTEKSYNDTTYEEAWFVHANSPVQYDPATRYFYYASGMVNSYSSMKDLFDDDDGMGNLGDIMGDDQNMSDMMKFKDNPASQDKLVRRPVNAKNEPEPKEEGSMSMSSTVDPHAEHLFHYGYGSIGAQAHQDVLTDKDKDFMAENTTDGREGPYFAECLEDKSYFERYPDMTHGMVTMDGKLYFNIGHSLYTFNKTISQMNKPIKNLTDLELVKVKEYNDVSYGHNGKRFVGGGFATDAEKKNLSLRYHPLAALDVHNVITWQDTDGDHKPDKRNVVPTLFVSVATNYSNSFKGTGDEFYKEEAYNYNPNFIRFNDDEESEEEKNDNVEFMWCANVVDKMPVKDMMKDLKSSGKDVTVKAYCGYNEFTEKRSAKFGLTLGEKTEKEDSALKHEYKMNNDEKTNICSRCLQDHDHIEDVIEDENVTWVYTKASKNDAGEEVPASMKATAKITCGDDYCNLAHKAKDQTVDAKQEDSLWKATFKVGTGDNAKNVVKTHEHEGKLPEEGKPEAKWSYTAEVKDADGKVTTPESMKCIVLLPCDCGYLVENPVDATPSEDHETWTATFEGVEEPYTHTHEYKDGVCEICGKGRNHTHEMVVDKEAGETWTYTAAKPAEGENAAVPESMTVSATLKCSGEHCDHVEKIENQAATKKDDNTWTYEHTTEGGQKVTLTHTHDFKTTQESKQTWKYTPANGETPESMTMTLTGTCSCSATKEIPGTVTYDAETDTWTSKVGDLTFTHKHSFGEKGVCECGATEKDCHHVWENAENDGWTQTKAPTCTQAGEESRKCTKCGRVETRPVDMLPHNFDKLPENPDGKETWLYDEATDTLNCSIHLLCSVCGAENPEATTVKATQKSESEPNTFTAVIAEHTFSHTHDWTTTGTCSCGAKEPVKHVHDYQKTAEAWHYTAASEGVEEKMTVTATFKCQNPGCPEPEKEFTDVVATKEGETWKAHTDCGDLTHTHKFDQENGTMCACGAVKPHEHQFAADPDVAVVWKYTPEVTETVEDAKQTRIDEIRAQYSFKDLSRQERKLAEQEMNDAIKTVEKSTIDPSELKVIQQESMTCTAGVKCSCGEKVQKTENAKKVGDKWVAKIEGVDFEHEHSFDENGDCKCGFHHEHQMAEDQITWSYNNETGKMTVSGTLKCTVKGCKHTHTVKPTEVTPKAEGKYELVVEGVTLTHTHSLGADGVCSGCGYKKPAEPAPDQNGAGGGSDQP